MSVSIEESSPLSEGQSGTLDPTISQSSTESTSPARNEDVTEIPDSNAKDEKSEPETPKPHPMAFTVDFGETKRVDNRRLEELAKKSQARHQRVQSMSASLVRPSPAVQKPPMSAKLPRKAQGYNSEGYFSSDQEDSGLSGSVKLRSPLTSSTSTNRHIKSPINDAFQPKRTSKSPIVDSIMSRSDNFTNRQGLMLPLKNSNSSYMREVHRTPSYGTLIQHRPMDNIIDQSPEGALMLTDISSPELDILTPDNGLATPEHIRSPISRKIRAQSETPDLLFQKRSPKVESLYIDDDVDRESNNSSTGTYTIEGDNYTEEQKARMSIDRTFGTDLLDGAIEKSLNRRVSAERDPELIFDFPNRVITKEPRRDTGLRSPVSSSSTFDVPNKTSKEKNVLEISCCYESPAEQDLATQTSKQIKSTRSYLEKIKSRVRTITEKTFAKSPPKPDLDFGNFTSVTTSGILSSKNPPKVIPPQHIRCSLAKSEIEQTDYIQRLTRESSVPVNLPSSVLPFDDAKFESTALKNAQKALRDDSGVSSDITPEQVVGKLSYLSLNRCKGDKTWIQDWAESVKKYNSNGLSSKDSETTFVLEDRPPLSPRHTSMNPRSPLGGTPTKIPSPVGTLLSRRTPDLIPTQDTEAYLLKTQNAISNLQAKLQSSRNNCSPSQLNATQLTSSLHSDRSKLPISQLSRSNSLNYRLRRKETDGSPLRSPGHYVITGSTKVPETTRILLNAASRSLDTDRRKDSNMNSPSPDRGLLSYSSDDKTLSNRPRYDVEAILSPHRKTHSRHKSYEGRNSVEHFHHADASNANETVCLKTVLKHNALETKYPRIDQTRCLETKKHHRVFSDGNKHIKPIPFGCSIKRSSSFNTVNKNNNYLESSKLQTNSRRSSGHTEFNEYLSDESENEYDKSKYKRPIHRGRIDSPELKSIAPANSPRCPNTPEMQRKFGPGLVRNSVRVTSKERGINTRMSEPPIGREERKPVNHQSRRISEPTRQAVLNRLTKSRSSTRELQPKVQDKNAKRPAQYRSSSALASKEAEFTKWKKRASYDPMKAAQEGRRRALAKRHDNKDDLSSPSHSSPVHRSQSFHTTNIADLTLDYSSEDTDDDHTLPIDPMITSTHSDILDLRTKEYDLRAKENLRRQALTNDVVLSRDYVTNFKVNQPTDKLKRQTDKRKTYILDDITPTKDNIDFLTKREDVIDKRKTFILDSDTNSTTNGSSPRNSSIFSHEKTSLTTGTSDTEGESGTESAPVHLRHSNGKRPQTHDNKRYSGDYSMSSSTTSITQKKPKEIQPRYLDISKYKNETSPRTFLKKDPSKTYIAALGEVKSNRPSAQRIEMEQKKQELEKWKRRASYDPRKAAALGKTNKTPAKTASSVLRSQSFHGPVLVSSSLRYQPPPSQIVENCDASSDNDF